MAKVEIRLVYLKHIRTSLIERTQLRVDRSRHCHTQSFLIRVIFVGQSRRHGQRTDNGHLDGTAGVSLEKAEIIQSDWARPCDFPDRAWRHGGFQTGFYFGVYIDEAHVPAFHRPATQILLVDAAHAEEVGVEALPPLLAIGDDLQSCAFLLGNRHDCGIVLRCGQHFGCGQPEAVARGRDAVVVDQPARLAVAADQLSGQGFIHGGFLSLQGCSQRGS